MDKPNEAAHSESCPYCKALEAANDPAEGACPYCAKMENPPAVAQSECKYCAAMEDNTGCKYCDAMNSAPQASGCAYCADMAHRDQECQYCGDAPNTNNPTTTNSEDFAGQGLDAPAMPKPIPGEDPQGQITPMDDTTNNNANLDPNGNGEVNVQTAPVGPCIPLDQPKESVQLDHSKEALMNIASQIEQGQGIPIPGAGPGPQGQAEAQSIDQADLAVGTDMQDNVSRPAGYGDNQPGDMGVGENGDQTDSPDLGNVLQEGLDAHADNIQREKVVQMVSQALQGFKASKQIVERAQTQAPQLYQASIMMLKAMIEMAKMLGLGPQEDPNANPSSGSEWQNPFPTHPDQGGAPVPGHAPSAGSASTNGDANTGNEWNNPFPTHPDNGGDSTIGQPIGKLPTSATTPHVAKEPIAEGGINAKGQKKITDPETGKVKMVDMKEGRVLNNEGTPVKPGNK